MKWLRLIAAVVLVVGLLAAVPTSLPIAEAAPKLSLSPGKPIASERFKVSGKLSTKVIRPIQLQRKSGKKWVTVAKAKTKATGAFAFTTATKKKARLRVVAPKAKVAKKTYKKVVSASKSVSLASQAVSYTFPASAYVNQSVVAKVTAKPARSGRVVLLQVRKSSSWVTVARGTQDKSGRATIRLVATTKGTYSYRVVSAASNGAATKVSGARTITIKPDKVAVDDSARVLSSDESKKITDYTASNGTLVLTSAPASAKTIAKGDVVPVPPRAGIQSGALRKVTSVTRSGSTTTVKTTDANLPEIIENIPDAASQLGLSVVSSEFVPEDGVVTESVPAESEGPAGGLAAASAGKLELKVGKSWKQGDATAEVSGKVSIAPLVELELDVDWGSVKHYKFGAGVEATNTLTAAAGYSKSAAARIPLGTLKQALVGWVGPVPVWVEATFEIYVTLSASGSVSVAAELSQTGQSLAGIQNKPRDLAPTTYLKNAATTSKVAKAEASGKLSGFAGAGADLMVYSAAGPYLRVGAMAEVGLSGDTINGWSCTLTYGPLAEAGLKTSAALAKLVGKEYTLASKTLVAPTTKNGCPWDQPGPPTPTPTQTPTVPATPSPSTPTEVSTTPGRVGAQTSAILVEDSFNVSSAVWTTELAGATISDPGPTIGLAVTFTPPAAGTYPYGVKVSFTDGSSKEFRGVIEGVAIPDQSIQVQDIQTAYVSQADDPCCGVDYSSVAFKLAKTKGSESTPLPSFSSLEDPVMDSFSYLSGDTNENRKLDLGESWTYQGRIFWMDSGESNSSRTRTISVYANDESGAQPWVETEASVTVVR